MLVRPFYQVIQLQQIFGLQGTDQILKDSLQVVIALRHVNFANGGSQLTDVGARCHVVKIGLKIIGDVLLEGGTDIMNLVGADILGMSGIVEIAAQVVDDVLLGVVEQLLHLLGVLFGADCVKGATAVLTFQLSLRNRKQRASAVFTVVLNQFHERYPF